MNCIYIVSPRGYEHYTKSLKTTAEKYGVKPRGVRIIFEALKLAGWKPTQKPLRCKILPGIDLHARLKL